MVQAILGLSQANSGPSLFWGKGGGGGGMFSLCALPSAPNMATKQVHHVTLETLI